MDVITVGITCFNAEGSIERAVRSAQEQTWEEVEIVAVDDCSSDRSWSILERLAGQDARIRIVRHPDNGGVAVARNTVLEHANGEFVAFFDDDDVSRPERLAAQRERIVQYERATGANTVVCYSATEQVFPDRETTYSRTIGMDETPAPAGEDVAKLILLGKPVAGGSGACPTSAQMARRDVLRSVGGFDARMRRQEDTDLNLRLALAGAHFAGVSRPLVVQSITVTGDKTVDEERRYALMMIEKHRQLLEKWNWHRFSRRWTEMKYTMLAGGKAAALPRLVPLLLTSPVKLARKTIWSLPNRTAYKRYSYPDESTG
jgi:glycosyltransferase involved in cell wall biosynthesis